MVDCKETKLRFRADQVFWSPVVVEGDIITYVSVHEDSPEIMEKEGKKMAKVSPTPTPHPYDQEKQTK